MMPQPSSKGKNKLKPRSRSLINFHLAAYPTPPRVRLSKREQIMKRNEARINGRNQLMQSCRHRPTDMTCLFANTTDNSYLQSIACDSAESLTVHFFLGFLGWDQSVESITRPVLIQDFEDVTKFNRHVTNHTKYLQEGYGILTRSRIYGYEVQYPFGHTDAQGSISISNTALIKPGQAMLIWAEQMICAKRNNLNVVPTIVIRLVQNDGSLFDTAFRTNAERSFGTLSKAVADRGVDNNSSYFLRSSTFNVPDLSTRVDATSEPDIEFNATINDSVMSKRSISASIHEGLNSQYTDYHTKGLLEQNLDDSISKVLKRITLEESGPSSVKSAGTAP